MCVCERERRGKGEREREGGRERGRRREKGEERERPFKSLLASPLVLAT